MFLVLLRFLREICMFHHGELDVRSHKSFVLVIYTVRSR